MNGKNLMPSEEKTGVDDVRAVREQIAREHGGDLAAHIAETKRIVAEMRRHRRLGPEVQPPQNETQRSGTGG